MSPNTLRNGVSLALTAFVVVMAALAPHTAQAREGAQSTGHGIKCYTAAVTQPDGKVKYQRVCYKGV